MHFVLCGGPVDLGVVVELADQQQLADHQILVGNLHYHLYKEIKTHHMICMIHNFHTAVQK